MQSSTSTRRGALMASSAGVAAATLLAAVASGSSELMTRAAETAAQVASSFVTELTTSRLIEHPQSSTRTPLNARETSTIALHLITATNRQASELPPSEPRTGLVNQPDEVVVENDDQDHNDKCVQVPLRTASENVRIKIESRENTLNPREYEQTEVEPVELVECNYKDLNTYTEFLNRMRNFPEKKSFKTQWSIEERVWLLILYKLFSRVNRIGNRGVDWERGLKIIPLDKLRDLNSLRDQVRNYQNQIHHQKRSSWMEADKIAQKLLVNHREYFDQLKDS